MSKLSLSLLVLAVLVGMTACGPKSEAPAPEASSEAAEEIVEIVATGHSQANDRLDAAEARRLLCLGFAGEILDRCGIASLGEHVRTAVADRLAQAPTGAEGV